MSVCYCGHDLEAHDGHEACGVPDCHCIAYERDASHDDDNGTWLEQPDLT